MVEQTAIHLYHGILIKIRKNELWIYATIWMNCQRIILTEKKLIQKGYIQYDSIYITFLRWKHYSNGESTSGCPELRRGYGVEVYITKKGNARAPCGDGTVLNLDCGVVIQTYACDKIVYNMQVRSKQSGWTVSMSVSWWWYCTILM